MSEKIIDFDAFKKNLPDGGPNNESSINRSESSTKTDSNKYNNGTMQAQLIHEIVNSAYNHHIIVDRYNRKIARDLADSVDCEKGKNAFILGSGPSLDDSIEKLKDWEGGIICSTSHALSLMHFGIEPTHIVVLDPFCKMDEILGVDWSKTRTKLVIHPGVWPDLVEYWPNDILMYIQNNCRPNSFYKDVQKNMYTWREFNEEGNIRNPIFHYMIRTEITIFACSPPMELFIAQLLGYENIFLAGCDFGYSETKDRFTDYTVDMATPEDGSTHWIKHEHPRDRNNPKEIISNNGKYTEEIHLFYKKNMLSAWRLCGMNVYTTDHGIVTEIPYHDINAVIKRQGFGFDRQSPFYIQDVTDKYLESVGAYVINTSAGTSFVECPNPEMDLPNYMQNILKRYHCEACGIHLQDEDKEYKDHAGEDCPKCGAKGGLKHDVELDIEKNMERIRKYYPKKEDH